VAASKCNEIKLLKLLFNYYWHCFSLLIQIPVDIDVANILLLLSKLPSGNYNIFKCTRICVDVCVFYCCCCCKSSRFAV